MRILLFLFSFFTLSIYISCGDENFISYDTEVENPYTKQVYLPTEIEDTYANGALALHTTYAYDSINRVTEVSCRNSDYIYTVDIKYNKGYTTVKSIDYKIVYSNKETEATKFTYEYISDTKVVETVDYVNPGGKGSYVNTLTLMNELLASKLLGTDNSVITYKHDNRTNLSELGHISASYDRTKGILSSAKTPYWVYATLMGVIPGSYNILNNVIEERDSSTSSTLYYEYVDFNKSKYPTSCIIFDGANTSNRKIVYKGVPKK